MTIEEESLLTADSALLDLTEDDVDDSDLFIKAPKKHKILMISDHPLATSGVGVQARMLITGLIETGKYTFRCLGAAIKHQDHQTIQVNEDFIIKPVDGFGNPAMIRHLLLNEKPDAILIFTDPRQFTWLWQIEDEIHQICPITYWHVWDNDPYPAFNNVWYESTDLINCLSQKTYDLVKPHFPEKTNYIPHAFPKEVYYPMSKEEIDKHKKSNFGTKADHFKALWVNRNANRKMPNDVLVCWKQFLEELKAKHGHDNALLIMHTDPSDQEGPNLLATAECLQLEDKVWFSTDKLKFDEMNMLHNITDCCVNIAKAEGFGLSTLVSMQVGKPVIALKTGGETSKVVNKNDGSHHGVAIEPCKRSLVGSQMVPYIYEDHAATQDVVDAFMKIYEMTTEEKDAMAQKCIKYVDQEFNIKNVISDWDRTLDECITSFKKTKDHNRWTVTEVAATQQVALEKASVEEKVLRSADVKKKSKSPKKRAIKTIDPNSI